MVQTQKHLGRNYAPGRFQCLAGKPRVGFRNVRTRSRRANLEHSTSVARPGRFIVPGYPSECSLLISRGRSEKIFANAQHLLTRFGNPCDVLFRSSGISRSPPDENKEEKKGRNTSATDTVLVSCADGIVWVRVHGKGSSTNSTALKDFAKEMIHRGAREFIVDLRNCSVMDSTFMGTLAGISLWLREMGEGRLTIVNPNERNAESLCSLGLDQLINVRVSTIKRGGQALILPPKEDQTARAQTMLEAHEALIKTAPENLPKFQDVIYYLEEKLHLSGNS